MMLFKKISKKLSWTNFYSNSLAQSIKNLELRLYLVEQLDTEFLLSKHFDYLSEDEYDRFISVDEIKKFVSNKLRLQ